MKERFSRIRFTHIRWTILIISFVLLTFGTHIFGIRIAGVSWNNVLLPTLACPFTTQGILDCSCYVLIHLKDYVIHPEVTLLLKAVISFIVFSIVFGRILCGFVCPFGLLQDILYKIRELLGIKPVRFTENQNKATAFLRWVFLAVFLGGYYVGLNFCYACPVMVTTPPFTGHNIAIYASGIVAVIFATGSFFKLRFWCTTCPLGLLIGLFHKISFFRLRKDCQACTECGACYEKCPMGIKTIYTEREKTNVTTHNCLLCGECVRICPENNGLALAFFKKKFYVAKRKNFFKDQGLKKDNDATEKIDELLKG